MKAQFLLLVILLLLGSCSEEPFFELEEPAVHGLKEQLQGDETSNCLNCRPASTNPDVPIPKKEQLQDQDEGDTCEGCRPLPPDPVSSPALDKEQLQGEPEEDEEPCSDCGP